MRPFGIIAADPDKMRLHSSSYREAAKERSYAKKEEELNFFA